MKLSTWEDVKYGDKALIDRETDEKSIDIYSYYGSIKAMVAHIPREISRNVYFFLKEENCRIDKTIHSVNYRPSPILTGGLEIPMVLNFKSLRYITHIKMKEFVTSLYSFDYVAKETQPSLSDEEEEINLLIEES